MTRVPQIKGPAWDQPELLLQRAPFVDGESIFRRVDRLLQQERNPSFLVAEALYWMQRTLPCDLNPIGLALTFLQRARELLAEDLYQRRPRWPETLFPENFCQGGGGE